MKLLAFTVVTVIAAGPLVVVAVAAFRLWETRRRDQAARDREALDWQHRHSMNALDDTMRRVDDAIRREHDGD